MKKFATYALIAFLIWWAAKDPAAAARLVHDFSGLFNHASNSTSTFTSGS